MFILLHHYLFPQLDGTWELVNLDAWVELNPKVKLEHAETMFSDLRLLCGGVDYFYGGWMEHRNHLLKDYYNKDVGEDHFWHLGIDYWVPLHTEVHLPINAKLIYSEMDKDQNGGWGGKLIFKYAKGYFILGHLDRIVTELRDYAKCEVIGKVGDRSVNGGWYPHLHVQCMKEFNAGIDGYSHKYEGIEEDFPNPTKEF